MSPDVHDFYLYERDIIRAKIDFNIFNRINSQPKNLINIILKCINSICYGILSPKTNYQI